MTHTQILAEPAPWPYDGDLRPENTALIIIDMQTDFCGYGGYCDQMGLNLTLTRKPIEPLQHVLETMRDKNFHILHTREGHRADLSDLNENKRWRSAVCDAEIGLQGPKGRILVRGEEGWNIVPELTPLADEPVIDKPGKGGFYATELDQILRRRGVRNLVVTGVTTDCCVHTTMRDASDRGYECLLLEDCCAATEIHNHETIVRITKSSYGQFGVAADSRALHEALS